MIRYSILLGLVLTFSSALSASKGCKHTNTSFNCVEYLENYDGDTLKVNVHHTHPLLGHEIGIRVNGIDTAEMTGKEACEKEMAEKAKNFVREVLSNSKRIDITNIQRGKFFRIVGDIIVDGQSLKELILDNYLAYPYEGGTKQKVDWCQYLEMAP